MKVLVISCSLRPESRSAKLAAHAADAVRAAGAEATLLDMRGWELPFCDGHTSYGHPSVEPLRQHVADSDAILMAIPVYNYGANAVAKNIVELTGKAWSGKVVGFLCAAGGRSSYMSMMGLASSLMLDFRCHIIPRFVYATGDDHHDNEDAGFHPHVTDRVEDLARETVRMAGALNTSPSDS